ncbi:MAG: type IV secretory system conjugative DNA transfer family protein [Acidiferrobacterales bacterium]
MKIILALMLAVLVLDFTLGAIFIPSALAALGALAGIGALFFLLRRAHPAIPAAGWQLGPALELTHPDRPTRVKNAVIAPSTLNLGLLIIGAPGAGKTVGVLSYLKQLPVHSPGAGWALFEGKGDIDIYKKSVAMGAAPDHFFSTELPGSETINLFAGDAPDVLDRLTKILIGETASTSFYMDEQRAVLARLVPLLRCLPVATSLRDLYVALTLEEAAREVIDHARAAGADPVEIALAEQWLNQPNRLKNIAGLLNRLFVFVSGTLAARLNAYQPGIDIPAIVAGGRSLYAHLPLTTLARDVAIALVELFGVEARKRQLGGTEELTPYPLLFDDWGAFFHEGFGPFSARCRSARMPLNFGFQSRAQLDQVSRYFTNELDDTIATKIILRVQGDDTGTHAVRLLGQYDATEVGTSESTGQAGRATTSLHTTQRYRIDARQLRELQPGEAYVSTLQKQGERILNPLWKLTLPEPPYRDWQRIAMPSGRERPLGEGLNLWDRYMTPVRLREDRGAPGAPGAGTHPDLAGNPGLREV